jgi:hypothetical protein
MPGFKSSVRINSIAVTSLQNMFFSIKMPNSNIAQAESKNNLGIEKEV